MLRTMSAVAAVLLLGRSAAAAEFDAEKAAKMYYEAHYQCRLGVTDLDLSEQDADRQCALRDFLSILLQTHNQCWDRSEQEWRACGPDGETPIPLE